MNDSALPADGNRPEYIVVARRYRPQNFDELIGQNQATRALRNAIETNRVGHAYLFTGARGVGKTSAARIFSKALNCEQGPTVTPCGECDICQGIAAGDDVDVLEIDGASNRGIDEIRQLRSNVNVRPSRTRFKIYIIDEVHMLTKEAFNALLKTLEEPPDHVKFIFCTTDPEKIPITVLSRCQRFDFAPVEKSAIVTRLQEIVTAEGAAAEPEALELLARRAAGSMRDSQSLLEQLLAFGGAEITVAGVHALLGTADSSSIQSLARALLQRNAADALHQLDAALQQGVDVGQLTEQLLGYLRDVMAATVGASGEIFRFASPQEAHELKEMGNEWGLPTLLASVQIVDQSLARMRQSVDRRTLVETALVRVSCLENLQSLAELIPQIHAAASSLPPATAATSKTPSPSSAPSLAMPRPTTPPKKKMIAEAAAEPAAAGTGQAPAATPPPNVGDGKAIHVDGVDDLVPIPSLQLTAENAGVVWDSVVDHLEGLDANFARKVSGVQLAEDNRLVVKFAQSINADRCRRPQQQRRIKSILQKMTGRQIHIDIQVSPSAKSVAREPNRKVSQQVLIREAMSHPFVKEAMELFDGDVKRVIDPSEGR